MSGQLPERFSTSVSTTRQLQLTHVLVERVVRQLPQLRMEVERVERAHWPLRVCWCCWCCSCGYCCCCCCCWWFRWWCERRRMRRHWYLHLSWRRLDRALRASLRQVCVELHALRIWLAAAAVSARVLARMDRSRGRVGVDRRRDRGGGTRDGREGRHGAR